MEGEKAMSVLDDLRAGMRALRDAPSLEPLRLFVPPSAFDRGEEWVRRAYGVGPDVEIIENLPLDWTPAERARPARRYPSAIRRSP